MKIKLTQSAHVVSIEYLWCVVIFSIAMVAANIIAVKPLLLFGVTLPAGVLVFPITYIIGDVISEVYGYKKARLAILLAFMGNTIFVIFSSLALVLPHPLFWEGQSAYITILGVAPRILIASAIGFLVGSLLNARTLVIIKYVTKEKYLWFRTITSTVVGEGVDSLLFASIAFYGLIPPSILIQMIVAQWLFKVMYEAIMTPVTYFVVAKFKKREVNNRIF